MARKVKMMKVSEFPVGTRIKFTSPSWPYPQCKHSYRACSWQIVKSVANGYGAVHHDSQCKAAEHPYEGVFNFDERHTAESADELVSSMSRLETS